MDYPRYKELFNIKHQQYDLKMNNLFELYYPKVENLSESQKTALIDIFDNAQILANVLKSLKDLGFDFSLSIVGGAVRDIALNKAETINDYDFVLQLDDSFTKLNLLKEKITDQAIASTLDRDEQSLFYGQLNSFEKYLSENQFKNSMHDPYLAMSNKKIEEQTKVKLLWQILVERQIKTLNKEYSTFRNKDVENKYLNQHIECIFQLNSSSNKKMDLILSERNGAGFAMTFDFEICKGVIPLDFLLESQQFKGNIIEEMLDEIWLMPSMLKDIADKTLTIRANNFTQDHINYFMGKHFLKLKEKFPHHTLNYCTSIEKDCTDNINLINYYKTKEQHDKLQEEMFINDDEKISRKIKL